MWTQLNSIIMKVANMYLYGSAPLNLLAALCARRSRAG
jgi:hypothetical protein